MLAFLVSQAAGQRSGPARPSRRCRSGSRWCSSASSCSPPGGTRVSQLIGFLVLDNGIATVAFLTAGGVPLVVELGVSLDVLLVVLILRC